MISNFEHPLLPRAVAQQLTAEEHEEFLQAEKELLDRLQPDSLYELHRFTTCLHKLLTKKVEPQ